MGSQPTSGKVWALLVLAASVACVVAVALLAPRSNALQPKVFLPSIRLEIDAEGQAKLQARRDRALAVGILQEDEGSWVDATLHEGEQHWDAKVRLKGDWTDHLEGNHWSYRVELRDGGAWRGMTVFSLQLPMRRAYLLEWLLHQVVMREGLLTTRYDFVRLQVNGQKPCIYAVEEHFTPQLLAHQGRLPGPILKIDEDGMWDARVASLQDPAFPYLQEPFFQAAANAPFKPKALLRDSVLRDQLQDGLRLMAQYRADTGIPAQVLDLPRMAKMYALTDLFCSYHSLVWHNRRYYYNPVTQLLEPIVFDGYNGPTPDLFISQPFWGYALHGHARDDADYRDVTSVYPFQDSSFVRAYYQALTSYCSPAFLDSLQQDFGESLDALSQILRSSDLGYRFDWQFLYTQAARIQQARTAALRPEQVRIRSTPLGDGRRFVTVANHCPVPIEAYVDPQHPTYLEADAGQGGQRIASFVIGPGREVKWRGLGE